MLTENDNIEEKSAELIENSKQDDESIEQSQRTINTSQSYESSNKIASENTLNIKSTLLRHEPRQKFGNMIDDSKFFIKNYKILKI